MKIKVEKKHISEGVRNSQFNCPIARAICEHIKEEVTIVVGTEKVEFISDFEFKNAKLPVEAIQFILAFDAKRPVVLFEFELDVPQGFVRG